MITRLGAYGGPRQLYGNFAGKVVTNKAEGRITRIGAYGGPRQLYSDFEGKAPSDFELQQITRIGAYGGPRQLYGAFEGKTEEIVSLVQGSGSSIDLKGTGYKLTAAQLAQLQREDEELVAIINIIGEHLL